MITCYYQSIHSNYDGHLWHPLDLIIFQKDSLIFFCLNSLSKHTVNTKSVESLVHTLLTDSATTGLQDIQPKKQSEHVLLTCNVSKIHAIIRMEFHIIANMKAYVNKMFAHFSTYLDATRTLYSLPG